MTDATTLLLKPIAVDLLVEEFITSKRADGMSERYPRDFRSRLGRFGKDFKTQVINVKTGDVDAWLRALRHSPRSRNNYRVLIITMFRFARACGYLPRDRSTGADHIARAENRSNPIEIYSSEERQGLLDHSDDHRSICGLGGGWFSRGRRPSNAKGHWSRSSRARRRCIRMGGNFLR